MMTVKWLALVVGLAVAQASDCPSGYRVTSEMSTCGECQAGMRSRHYCGSWSIFGYCFNDCYECWSCELIPTRQPSSRPTGRPTSRPSLYPTKKPTFFPTSFPTRVPTQIPTANPTQQPTQAPSLHPQVVRTALDNMWHCISRNLADEDLQVAWNNATFQEQAGESLRKRFAALGFSLSQVEGCFAADGSLKSLVALNATLPPPNEDVCISYGMLFYIQTRLLPALGMSHEDIYSLSLYNATALCPTGFQASWEPFHSEIPKAVLHPSVSLVELRNVLLKRSLKPHGVLVHSPRALPKEFFEWLEKNSIDKETFYKSTGIVFSNQASKEILGEAATTVNQLLSGQLGSGCESKTCQAGAWYVESRLENGDLYAVIQSSDCQCINMDRAFCPPQRASNPTVMDECSVGTFADVHLDEYFSSKAGSGGEEATDPKVSEPASSSETESKGASVGTVVSIVSVLCGLVVVFVGVSVQKRRRKKQTATKASAEERRIPRTEMIFIQNRTGPTVQPSPPSRFIPGVEMTIS